jgi:hypothetical protein
MNFRTKKINKFLFIVLITMFSFSPLFINTEKAFAAIDRSVQNFKAVPVSSGGKCSIKMTWSKPKKSTEFDMLKGSEATVRDPKDKTTTNVRYYLKSDAPAAGGFTNIWLGYNTLNYTFTNVPCGQKFNITIDTMVYTASQATYMKWDSKEGSASTSATTVLSGASVNYPATDLGLDLGLDLAPSNGNYTVSTYWKDPKALPLGVNGPSQIKYKFSLTAPGKAQISKTFSYGSSYAYQFSPAGTDALRCSASTNTNCGTYKAVIQTILTTNGKESVIGTASIQRKLDSAGKIVDPTVSTTTSQPFLNAPTAGGGLGNTSQATIGGLGSGSSTGSTASTGGNSECNQKCEEPAWWNLSFEVNMRNTLCQMQCGIIDWYASVIQYLFENVLMKSIL